MKLITVQFPDSTDITIIPKGMGGITVSDGTNNISGGEIMALTDMVEPELIPHIHPATTNVGPPVP